MRVDRPRRGGRRPRMRRRVVSTRKRRRRHPRGDGRHVEPTRGEHVDRAAVRARGQRQRGVAHARVTARGQAPRPARDVPGGAGDDDG